MQVNFFVQVNVFKMAATRWTEERSVKFVLCYQKYPCLWNTKSLDYKNRDLRDRAVAKIIEEMRENGVFMTTADVKNRIKTIRTTYSAELRKIKKSAKSGSGTDELYVPSCAWFKIADSFLRNTVALRETCDNLESQTTSCDEDYLSPQNIPNTPEPQESNIPESTPTSSVSKRSQKRVKGKETADVTAAVTKLENICKNSVEALTEDEFDTYGRHVASQLRSMELERAIDVQAQFNNILSKARIEDLREKKKNAEHLCSISKSSELQLLNTPPSSHAQSDVDVHSGMGEDVIQTFKNMDGTDILSQAVSSILNDDYDTNF